LKRAVKKSLTILECTYGSKSKIKRIHLQSKASQEASPAHQARQQAQKL